MVFTAQQIAGFTGGTVEGNPEATISTFAKIEEGTEGALSFLANPQYEHYIYETKSSIVLVNNDFVPSQEVKATMVRVQNAYESVAKLLQLYQSMQQKRVGIDSLAFIDKSAKIGKDCYVGPFVAIAEDVEIGEGCVIHPHVTIGKGARIGNNTEIYSNAVIYHGCVIGNNCILHAGCVIGADGFGFAPTANGYDKIPQIGIVTIEDNVEIGANTCIDRSTMGSTIIRKGVKLDNLVQIAHNVEVGSHTVMSSQVGVAGSSKVGEWCMFAGQVGVAGHLKVGDRTVLAAQSGLAGGNLAKKGGAKMMGYPAIDHLKFAKNMAALNSLPALLKEVAELKKEINELKNNK
ncbi:MAG: UDP-3-O-(3-hydroxymyristoyl)glucosamine N-acyltransferase [Prevotellaceae bacterium]|nr:UDP-3-O-(3-hydroxymyristoyl)glucosamine N-acyltransferase [Candidatus Minthosoma caballi]